MRKSGRCESKEGKQQDCSIARATRGLGSPRWTRAVWPSPATYPKKTTGQ